MRKQKTERLTEEAFQKSIQSLPLGERTKIIAYGVLVEGRRQIELSREFGISKSAVSQSVHRVVSAYKNVIPEGFERISVVLPSSLIPQVLEWEKEANLSKPPPFSKKRTTK